MADTHDAGVVAATIVDRLVARCLDLQIMAAAFLPVFVFVFVSDGGFPLFPYQEWEFESAIWAGSIAGVAAEFLMLGYKRTTFGKWAIGIALVESRAPLCEVPSWRLIVRFSSVIGACSVVFVASITVAGKSVSRLNEAQVLTHLSVALVAIWVLSLSSALLNSDRRGWHDLLAGTMLVSTGVPLSERRVRRGSGA